jgi:hypothetical protein
VTVGVLVCADADDCLNHLLALLQDQEADDA